MSRKVAGIIWGVHIIRAGNYLLLKAQQLAATRTQLAALQRVA
jgi:hypothetical protein